MPFGRSQSASSNNAGNGAAKSADGVERAAAACAALRALLGPSGAHNSETSAAIRALEALKLRLDASVSCCAKAGRKAGDVAAAHDNAASTIAEVEHSIIETKMKLGGLLETKDVVAREVSKAKRELASLPEKDEALSGTRPVVEGIGVENGDPGATGGDADMATRLDENGGTESQKALTFSREQEAQEELARLAMLDAEIVQVTDEMNTIRKRRAVLEKKLSTAYNEF